MSEMVTVIIPVYNMEKYLEKCLESVISQIYSNLQIILVDDGSTDKSLDICERYAESDNRIRVISKENGGISSARNVGLRYAEGKYCYFIDSDDYVEPDLIEKAVNKIQSKNADMVVFGINRVDENYRMIENFCVGDRDIEFNDSEQMLKFLACDFYQYHIPFEVWNKLYKMDIIRENNIRFEDNHEVFAEDVCFVSYYLMHTKKIACMNDCLYNYLIRNNSITALELKRPVIERYHYLLQYIYNYIAKYDQYIIDRFEYIYASLMHDQYKRTDIGDIPKYLTNAENFPLFEEMSERAYAASGSFISFFGLKTGDLLADECIIVHNRENKGKVQIISSFINIKRKFRTALKKIIDMLH